MLVFSIHEITPENYKFFKGVVPMDKITYQVRAEYWTKIMNECINSGMSKSTCAGKKEILEKQFFSWRGFCAGKLLRMPGIRHYWQLSNRIRSWRLWLRGRFLLLNLNFYHLRRTQLRFSIRVSWSVKEILSWRLQILFRMNFSRIGGILDAE